MWRLSFLIALPLCALLFYTQPASADGNCPPGYFPIGGGNAGWEGCAPYEVPTDGGPPVDPGPQWAIRWGAIAVDGAAGKYGGIEGMSSQSSANKAAVKLCRQNGGSACKVLASYHNQCGSMAWGDDRYSGYTGPNYQQTMDLAVAECAKATANCKPY
jgi:hypothetical protein